MTPADGPPPFSLAAAGLAALGCLLAVVAPFVGSPTAAFRGSVVATGVIGLVFAAQTLRVLRVTGRARLAPALLLTVFGVIFAVTPLLYEGVGTTATATAQTAGVLTAAFAGYLAVESIETLAGVEP
jgi:hypothetical protein